jgi:hypothetical protein
MLAHLQVMGSPEYDGLGRVGWVCWPVSETGSRSSGDLQYIVRTRVNMATAHSLLCTPILSMDMVVGVPTVWVETGDRVSMHLCDRENVGGTSAIVYQHLNVPSGNINSLAVGMICLAVTEDIACTAGGHGGVVLTCASREGFPGAGMCCLGDNK